MPPLRTWSLGIAAVLMLMVSSGCSRRMLGPQGLPYAKIGEAMPQPERNRWKGWPIADTTFEEGGYRWPGLVLSDRGGPVYLEGDFFGRQQLNRLRVESERFRTPLGVRVGSTLQDLRSLGLDWESTWLGDYQVYDLVPMHHPAYHFLVSAAVAGPADSFEGLPALPDTVRVTAIVIM